MKRVLVLCAALALVGCVAQPDTPKPVTSASALPEVKAADFSAAAAANDREAQVARGKMLLDQGSYFDPLPEAVALLEKAAQDGSVEAQMALGYRYRAAYCSGPAIRLDRCNQARRWFQAAAETGDLEAMGVLVAMLSHPPLLDRSQAYYWALLRQRQKAMPSANWVEECTALKSALSNDIAVDQEKRVSQWQPKPVAAD